MKSISYHKAGVAIEFLMPPLPYDINSISHHKAGVATEIVRPAIGVAKDLFYEIVRPFLFK